MLVCTVEYLGLLVNHTILAKAGKRTSADVCDYSLSWNKCARTHPASSSQLGHAIILHVQLQGEATPAGL